jgi:hypothetical protein
MILILDGFHQNLRKKQIRHHYDLLVDLEHFFFVFPDDQALLLLLVKIYDELHTNLLLLHHLNLGN